MRPLLVLTIAAGLALGACRGKPAYLERAEAVDELCEDEVGKKAYTYLVEQPDSGGDKLEIPDSAVKWGCTVPAHAWTDARDEKVGGVRGKAFALRNDEGKTLMCCAK